MLIIKKHLKILRYIYKKKTVSYKKVKKHFRCISDLEQLMDVLVFNGYITKTDEHPRDFGEYTEITDSTLFQLNTAGIVEIERHQWFDSEYVVSHIVIPIVIAVLSTLITIFLSQTL